MDIENDVFCILGASVGMGREVLLYGAPVEEGVARAWTLLSVPTATKLLPWLDECACKSRVTSFIARRAISTSGAPIVAIHAVRLSSGEFSELQALAESPGACLKVTAFREILHAKNTEIDWQTAGMLQHVFYHLDR